MCGLGIVIVEAQRDCSGLRKNCMSKGKYKGKTHYQIFSIKRICDVLSLMQRKCNPFVNYLIFLLPNIQNFIIRVLLFGTRVFP